MTRLRKRPGGNAGQVPSVRVAVVSWEDPQGIPHNALHGPLQVWPEQHGLAAPVQGSHQIVSFTYALRLVLLEPCRILVRACVFVS